jgi:hypothetical protein
VSLDDIEWDEPPADGEITWDSPRFEQPEPPPFKPIKAFVRRLRKLPSGWVIVMLLICLVASTTIVILENMQIARLNNELDGLQGEYDHLQQDYDNLQQDFDSLLSDYGDLFSDYSALKVAFEDPLTSPATPTIYAVRNWLAQDDTDECAYVDGVWTCGDFSAMLMTRAKEMNWRVRIAVISYSLQGEPYYGSTTNAYGSHGHAFNVIECIDGIWYIEPQTDGTWYIVEGGTGDRTEFAPYTYYDFVDSDLGTIWDGYNWWTNYYNQFA